MKYHPGGINHGAGGGTLQKLNSLANRFHYPINGGGRTTSHNYQTRFFQALPDKLDQQVMRVGLPKPLNPLVGEHPVHAGKTTKLTNHNP